ncbi:MAG: hypothetical protein JWL92_226 [Candidatus Nomurabacteria bacterium]|nr:hypothetical protein [Candidatus Nomurabacteria bacterium]
MIRTLIGIILLIVAILWLPLWVQLVLFAIFILIDANRSFAVIPAVISDALYAPGSVWNVHSHWMTLLVLAALLLYYIVIKKLRVRSTYGLEA